MKVPAYRILTLGLVLIILLDVPAASVSPPRDHTVVQMFFEKDRMPYNESVRFSITCFGMDCDGRDCRESTKARLAESGQIIYSGVYADYGGIRSITTSPFTGIYTRCDIAGTTASGNFSIENYSVSPFGDCIDIRKNYGKYYYQAPEHERCVTEYLQQLSLCDSYATSCSLAEKDCIRLMTGRYGRDTEQFRTCYANVTRNLQSCSSYMRKMDSNIIIMWNDSRDFQSVPDLQCELRLVLPPSNQTPVQAALTSEPSCPFRSPVESLYCGILRFFGGRCE